MPPGGKVPRTSWWLCRAIPICLRLLEHLARAAASRTFWTAGKSRPIRMAMMAITTRSSISVNAGLRHPAAVRERDIAAPWRRNRGRHVEHEHFTGRDWPAIYSERLGHEFAAGRVPPCEVRCDGRPHTHFALIYTRPP